MCTIEINYIIAVIKNHIKLLFSRHKYSPHHSGIMPSLRETVILIWKTGIGVAMVALCGVLVGKCIVKSKKDLMS